MGVRVNGAQRGETATLTATQLPDRPPTSLLLIGMTLLREELTRCVEIWHEGLEQPIRVPIWQIISAQGGVDDTDDVSG